MDTREQMRPAYLFVTQNLDNVRGMIDTAWMEADLVSLLQDRKALRGFFQVVRVLRPISPGTDL
jgi:hypothetical protein